MLSATRVVAIAGSLWKNNEGKCCSKTGTRYTYAAYYVLLESDSNTPQHSNVQVGGGKSMRRLLLPHRFNCISLLADVATELLTHPDESAINVAGSRTHARGSCQCYKGDNQHVLDQSLATLVVVKSLQQSKRSGQFVSPLIQNLNGFMDRTDDLCNAAMPVKLAECPQRESASVMFRFYASDIKRGIGA